VIALDAEVSNSTHADQFKKAFPDRFFEMYIAEQQMVSAAVGLQVRGYVPSFRPLRPSSRGPTTSSGWRRSPGRTSGWSGPMRGARSAPTALPDGARGPGLLAGRPGIDRPLPSDAVSTVKLVAEMADRTGIVYLRTTRNAYP